MWPVSRAALGAGSSSNAGCPRNAAALAGEDRGACGERREVTEDATPGHKREGCVQKGMWGHLSMQTRVTEQTPGHSNSIPGEPEGNHLKFKDKMGRGGGSGHSL